MAKQLTITVHVKRSAAFQARMSAQDKLDKLHKLLDRTGKLHQVKVLFRLKHIINLVISSEDANSLS